MGSDFYCNRVDYLEKNKITKLKKIIYIMTKQSIITVIGSNGGIGAAIVDELIKGGYTNIRGVTISGKEKWGRGIKVVRADARIKPELVMACEGSEVIFGAFNASEYTDKDWAQEFPMMMDSFLSAGNANEAKLIFIDNLYSYQDLEGNGVYDENTLEIPVSKKGEIRKGVSKQFVDGIVKNNLKGNIIKSSDLYGPYALNSMIGDRFFASLFKKNVGEVLPLGNIPHSFTYTRDAGRIAVMTAEGDSSSIVIHTPNSAPIGLEDLASKTFGFVSGNPKISIMPKVMFNVVSLFIPAVKSIIAMKYEWNNRFEVGSVYNKEFVPTSTDDGVRETVTWFKNNL
jgi:nucleoside-diphosphate-sugar epimerase